MKKNNCAIYCRLSKEDHETLESSSISNQKELLIEFAKKNEFEIFDIYIDDGYSGGNFNRPAWQRLLKDIENKKINILITKDLSRLGRDYIGTGYYTEEYFPKYHVRYIAVNDNYDSNNNDDDITPFKNIINQWYLKDLSKKVKSVHELRMKKGNLPKGNIIPMFGYKHTINNERIIDNESSKTVKKVFELYNKGFTTKEIKECLTNLNMPIPSYYNYIKYNYNTNYWINQKDDKKYDWNYKIINYIISNIQYTGTLELKKTKTISYKTHQRVKTKEDEKYIFNNRFPAIISKYEFEKANALKVSRTRSNITRNENIFQNIVYCGNCMKPLSLIRNNVYNTKYYICRNQSCQNKTRINYKSLELYISFVIDKLIIKILQQKDLINNYLINYKEYNSLVEELKTLKDRINKIKSLITNLYLNEQLPLDIKEDINNKYLLEYNKIKNRTVFIEDELNKDNELIIQMFLEWLDNQKTNKITTDIITNIFNKIIISKENKQFKVNIFLNKKTNQRVLGEVLISKDIV